MFRVQMEFKTQMHYELVYLSKWITKFIASCFYLEIEMCRIIRSNSTFSVLILVYKGKCLNIEAECKM